jgi:hypothetical protein
MASISSSTWMIPSTCTGWVCAVFNCLINSIKRRLDSNDSDEDPQARPSKVKWMRLLRLLRLRPRFNRALTEDDIHYLVAEGARVGVIHAVERDMIEGVLDLADSPVRSIMAPRMRYEPSPRRVTFGRAGALIFGRSPATASKRSVRVTMPCSVPNSSTTTK